MFRTSSCGTIPCSVTKGVMRDLERSGQGVVRKLELYMFANAASRMYYLLPEHKAPHIESFANHHDIVARLGSLAIDELHTDDLLHIDGSLFTCNRYGHLLNAHYLDGFARGAYELCVKSEGRCVDTSVHDPVRGNPCTKNPDYLKGPPRSRLFDYLHEATAAWRPAAHAPNLG